MSASVSDVSLVRLTRRVIAADPDSRLEVFDARTGGLMGDTPRCTPADVAAAARA